MSCVKGVGFILKKGIWEVGKKQVKLESIYNHVEGR